MTLDDNKRVSVWQRYWASGVLHSCPGSFVHNYDGSIRQFWLNQLSTLHGRAKILDIATGNGALPQMFIEASDQPIDIYAVDCSAPKPSWIDQLKQEQKARLHWISPAQAEQLPFANEEFDWVTSQFGIEYAHSAAIDELNRVLKPNGSCALIVHHHQSRLARVSRVELEHLCWILGEDGPLERAHQLLPSMTKLSSSQGLAEIKTDAQANRKREQFNVVMNELQRRAQASEVPDMLHETADVLMQLLQSAAREGLVQAQNRLLDLSSALADTQFRHQEFLSHALDQQRIDAWRDRLSLNGHREVTVAELHYDQYLVGWSVVAKPIQSV